MSKSGGNLIYGPRGRAFSPRALLATQNSALRHTKLRGTLLGPKANGSLNQNLKVTPPATHRFARWRRPTILATRPESGPTSLATSQGGGRRVVLLRRSNVSKERAASKSQASTRRARWDIARTAEGSFAWRFLFPAPGASSQPSWSRARIYGKDLARVQLGGRRLAAGARRVELGDLFVLLESGGPRLFHVEAGCPRDALATKLSCLST